MADFQANQSKTEEQLAEEAFSLVRRTLNMVETDATERLVKESAALGRNILKEELGAFTDPFRGAPPYNLDDDTRDRLIAHAREDIASVYSLCVGIATMVKAQQRSINLTKIWLAIFTILVSADVLLRHFAE